MSGSERSLSRDRRSDSPRSDAREEGRWMTHAGGSPRGRSWGRRSSKSPTRPRDNRRDNSYRNKSHKYEYSRSRSNSRERREPDRTTDGFQDGGKGRGSQPWRSGDWKCTSCEFHNFASRSSCKQCGARNSSSFGADRQSGYRSRDNGQRDRGYYRGDRYQGNGARDDYGSNGPSKGSRDWRAGDWKCDSCQGHNFAAKTACYRCGVPKP